MASTTAPPPSNRQQMRLATGTQAQTETQLPPILHTQPVLRLRGAAVQTRNEPRVQWAEGVIDNEHMGKKSSKVCCIYHAPKPIDESSDESSSDSSSSDESDNDDGSARPVGGSRRGRPHRHNHNHRHDHSKDGKGKGRAPSPNAYEKMPRPKDSSHPQKN